MTAQSPFPTATPTPSNPPTILSSANATIAANSTLLAAATASATPPTLNACPNIDNTTFTTTNAQKYQIHCYRDYEGPSYLGLQEPSFLACIDMCDNVNQASSGQDCAGVSWRPDVDTGVAVKCDLKNQVGSILRFEFGIVPQAFMILEICWMFLFIFEQGNVYRVGMSSMLYL